MARVCAICDRGTIRTSQRSHSNIKTKKQSFLNLQTKVIKGERKKVCTSCIKSLAKKA